MTRDNAEQLAVTERVNLVRSDLFASVPVPDGGFRLIVSNPPYIPSADVDALMPDVLRFEPRLALDGGRDGLDLVRRLAQGARERLQPEGALLIEIGVGQAEDGMALLREAGFVGVVTHRDLGRIPRVIEGRRAAA